MKLFIFVVAVAGYALGWLVARWGWRWREEWEAYPVTVVLDRWEGSFSGARWLALWCEPRDVPVGLSSGRTLAYRFFCSEVSYWVGRGSSPDAAVVDLDRRLTEHPPPDEVRQGSGRYWIDYGRAGFQVKGRETVR